MKSRKILFIVLGLFVLIMGITYYFDGKNTDVTQKNPSYSAISFSTEPISNGIKGKFFSFRGVDDLYTLAMRNGDSIDIKYKSRGLKLAVLDNKYNVVKDFQADSTIDYNFKCTDSGKYHIRIYGKKISGNFELKFNNIGDIVVTESNFWD